MPKSSNILCHASPSRITKSQACGHIWISDDILVNTFNAFVRNHKRHGSNVPGPLEAQRRAAKRRATHIAYNAPFNPGFQPFEIFGAKPKGEWWDKDLLRAKALEQASSWLWSFLSPPKPPEIDAPRQEIEASKTADELLQLENFKGKEKLFLDQLQGIKTYDALLALIQKLSIDLMQQPHLTQTILQHALAESWEFGQVEAFLLEPRMNPPGSMNFRYLMQSAEQHRAILTKLLRRKVYIKAATLGLIGVEDLKIILMLAPKVVHYALPSGHPLEWASFCIDLLSALHRSKVIHPSDLGILFMVEWLKLIKPCQFQPAKAELLWTIYTFLGHSGRKALQKIITNAIQTINGSCVHYLASLSKFALSKPHGLFRDVLLPITQQFVLEAASEYDPVRDDREHQKDAAAYQEALLKIVLVKPRKFKLAAEATTQILEGPYSDVQLPTRHLKKKDLESTPTRLNRQPTNLEKWYTFLTALDVPDVTLFRLRPGHFTAYPNSQELGTKEQTLFVTQLWISMALYDRRRWSLDEPTRCKISHLFSRLFLHSGHVKGEDKLLRFMRVIRSLPLPAKHKLLWYAYFACDSISYTGQTYAMLLKKVDDLERGDITNISNSRYYYAARSSFPALLSKVAESMNEDMQTFENTFRSVVRTSSKGPVLVARLLIHNHELKFALRQAAVLSFSSPLRWENRVSAQKIALGNYSYIQLVDMINNFALECATSPYMSPRNGIRKVFWFYKFLHRCRAPIRPSIIDALWIAGVERYEGFAGTEVLSWLYRITVAYQGEGTAKAYLQQAIHRDRSLERIALSISNRSEVCDKHGIGDRDLRPPKCLEQNKIHEEQEEEVENADIPLLHRSGDTFNVHKPENFSHSDTSRLPDAPISSSPQVSKKLSQSGPSIPTAVVRNVMQNDHLLGAEVSSTEFDVQSTRFDEKVVHEPDSNTTPILAHLGGRTNIETESGLKPNDATSTTTSFQNTQCSDNSGLELLIQFDDPAQSDMALAMRKLRDRAVATKYGISGIDAEKAYGNQEHDLHRVVSLETWLSTKCSTLDDKMRPMSFRKASSPAGHGNV